jgi:hypothetical protein
MSSSGRSRFCSRTTQPRDSSPGCPRDDERAGRPRADLSFAIAEQWSEEVGPVQLVVVRSGSEFGVRDTALVPKQRPSTDRLDR